MIPAPTTTTSLEAPRVKRYHYFVSYWLTTPTSSGPAMAPAITDAPLDTFPAIRAVAEWLRQAAENQTGELGGRVSIMAFQLIRTEEVTQPNGGRSRAPTA